MRSYEVKFESGPTMRCLAASWLDAYSWAERQGQIFKSSPTSVEVKG